MSDKVEKVVKLYGKITGKRSVPKPKIVDTPRPVPIAVTKKPNLK